MDEPTEAEKEEQAQMQTVIAQTQRKMMAQKYEQMEIEDEKRDGVDQGQSNF